jgi:YidC/Oxa1 family membrane protein insertase
VVIARWQKGEFASRGELRAEILKNPGKIASRDDDVNQERVAWAAQTNMYFACIMAPTGRRSPEVPAEFASVEPVVLDPAVVDHADDLTFRYITRPMVVAPGQSRQIGFDCYIGPKSKAAFEAVAAYRERNYYEVIRESFYFCAPDALVGLMMSLLDLFHRVPPNNYGVAIIILVLLVRLLLHPLTKKSQVNMTKMQDQQARLKPKLDAIRQKYANDRVRMNQAQMELYREEGINPAGSMLSCLPMMLQLPIWAALWTALASTIEMRHAPFDGYWIRDLASPDAVYVFAQPVTIPIISWFMGGPMTSINLLPILLCISQMLQTKFMPKTPTPQTSEGMPDQRKMMMFMSVMFIFFLWNAPSGLNLYIMSSNFFGILEQSRIRKHLKELEARREEDEAKRRAKVERRKQSWLYRKWQELAREAEEARKIKSSREHKER